MLRWLRDKWRRDLVTLREKRERNAQRHRDRKILCPRCGYDVKAMPDRPCSECGLFIESRWRRGWLAAGSDGRWCVWFAVAHASAYLLLWSSFAAVVGVHDLLNTVLPITARNPDFWLTLGVIAFHIACTTTVVLVSIRRRIRLLHGPLRDAARSLAIAVVVVIGPWVLLLLLFRNDAG